MFNYTVFIFTHTCTKLYNSVHVNGNIFQFKKKQKKKTSFASALNGYQRPQSLKIAM